MTNGQRRDLRFRVTEAFTDDVGQLELLSTRRDSHRRH